MRIAGELGALGGVLLYHPFRENGKYGLANGYKTGNDGNPDNWRLAPHYHGIIVFNGIPQVREVAEISARTGWTVKFKTPEDEDLRKTDTDFSEARIKTLDDCEYLARYIYSHVGAIYSEGSNRRRTIVFYIRASNPRQLRTIFLRPGVELLRQGYTAMVDDPEGGKQPLYWRDLLRDLSSQYAYLGDETIKRLSEVELINAAIVQCDVRDYADCCTII